MKRLAVSAQDSVAAIEAGLLRGPSGEHDPDHALRSKISAWAIHLDGRNVEDPGEDGKEPVILGIVRIVVPGVRGFQIRECPPGKRGE